MTRYFYIMGLSNNNILIINNSFLTALVVVIAIAAAAAAATMNISYMYGIETKNNHKMAIWQI
jgi:hypothetical protein